MPISDEVIELAPVKKTKKTLIILISTIGVLFAAAVAFLVLYLVKPSVTENPTVVRGVSVTPNGFFSVVKDDEQTDYASIGNEYTIHSTIAVEKNTSPNILWRWEPHEALEVVDVKENGEDPHITFKPRMGFDGREVTVTAQSRADVNKSDTYKFKIVNQGTEQIAVASYGSSTNQKNVTDSASLTIDVPYYSLSTLQKYNEVYLFFNQYGVFSNGEHAPRTLYEDKKTGKNTYDLSVTVTKNANLIQITSVSPSKNGGRDLLLFKVKGSGEAEIKIDANVHNNTTDIDGNNVNVPVVSKTFKVNIQTNAQLDYVDSMYILDKPVVDGDFIKASLDSGKTGIDKAKLAENAKNKGAKLSTEKGVTLTLPYRATYYDLFKHVVLNPVKIQYVNEDNSLRENWYKNLDVKASDGAVRVTKDKDGNVVLDVTALDNREPSATQCTLTITDTKTGGIGINEKINVSIIAQTSDMTYSVSDGTNSYSEDAKNPGLISIDSIPNASYTVTLEYTFMAPKLEEAAELIDKGYINNVIIPTFEKSQLSVTEVVGSKLVEVAPAVAHAASAFKVANPTGAPSLSTYKATLELTVKIDKNATGVVALDITKPGTVLGDESAAMNKLDKSFTKRIEFNITVAAIGASLVGTEAGTNLITQGHTKGGNYIVAGGKVTVYVQKETEGTTLALTDANSEWFVKNLIIPEPVTADFIVTLSYTSSIGFSSNDNKVFKFKSDTDIKVNGNGISNSVMGNFTVKVSDLAKKEIASFNVDIWIIDVVTLLVTNPDLTEGKVAYSATPTTGEYYQISNTAIQIVRENVKTPLPYTAYSGVKLYYGESESALTPLKSDDGSVFYYEADGVKTLLYSYDAGSKRITPLTDIYAESYKHKVNFSHIFVGIVIGGDEFIGKHKAEPDTFTGTCYVPIMFERRVDGVALYESDDYVTEVAKVGGNYEYRVNQQQPGTIYSSPVIMFDEQSVPAYSAAGKIAATKSSRIFVPTGFALNNTGSGRYYQYLDFTAPTVTGADGVDRISGFFVEATDNTSLRTNLIIVVQNEMRGIDKIEFYKDSTLSQKFNASDVLLFGAYNNATAFTRDVYVKVSYADFIDAYTGFESAMISLPTYLSLAEEFGVTAVSASSGLYKFTPDVNTLKDLDKRIGYSVSFKCSLTFNGTGAHNGDKFSVYQQNNPPSRATADCGISVGTGLQEITVTGEGFAERTVTKTQQTTIAHTFNLKNTVDKPSFILSLSYEALIDPDYGILFNNKTDKFNATFTCADTGVLSVSVRAKADSPTVTISVNTVKSVSTPIRVVITFTDSADGTATEFVLNLDITINVDIFALDFEQAGGSYTVTTTGGSTGNGETAVSVKYNNGTTEYQPLDSVKDKVKVYVAQYADGEYSKYESTDVRVDGGKLYVSNELTEVRNLFVVVEYKISDSLYVRSEYRPIVVKTNANDIRLVQNTGDVKVTDGVAKVTVTNDDSAFSLPAEAYNISSLRKVETTISYGIYTSRECTTVAPQATVGADGEITFAPTAASGKVYYRAWFVDNGENCSGKTKDVIVEISYDVAVTSVALENIDSDTFYDGTIYLYFQNSSAYTYLDLANYIVASSSFQAGLLSGKPITKSVAEVGAYRILSITGSTSIRPTKSGETTIKITVEYNGSECSQEYNVVVRSIGGLELNEDSGEIDIITNNTLTVTPVITDVDGFTAAYALSYSGDNLTIADGTGNSKTVSLADQASSRVGEFTLKASARYTLDAGNSSKLEGTIMHSIDYTVKIVCDYTADFDLKNGTENIPVYDGTNATKYAISNSDTEYTLSVINNVDNAHYSFAKSNGVIKLNGNKVTVEADNSGEVTITLTATMYGKTFTASKKYYFAYGAEPVCSLSYSTNGTSYNYMPDSLAIDYTTQKVRIKYSITGVDTATVKPENVSIIYSGDVTMGTITALPSAEGKGYFVVFTVNGDCEFTVGGTINVGTRTVYLSTKTATLTATAPVFTLSASKTALSPADGNNTATITVSANSGFKGAYSITGLTVVEGSALVSVDGTTVTVGNTVVDNGTAVVRAQITVTNGLFADTYYKQITLNVNGIAKPVVAWNSTVAKTLSVGGKSTYKSTLTSPAGYSYNSFVSTNVTANGNGLVQGADFTFNSGTGELVIRDTDKTRAGGKITLTVEVTVTVGAHNGLKVSDSVDVVVLPMLSTSNVTLANAVGEYDFGTDSSVAPYVGTHDGAVKSDDGHTVKSLVINNTGVADAFAVNGSKLLINKNILSSTTTLSLTVTVEILDGAHKGRQISGDVTVEFTVPNAVTKNVTWNGTTNAYDTLGLSELVTLPESETSAIGTVSVAFLSADYDGLTVNNNGTANPSVAIAKTFNMGFGGDSIASKTVSIGFTVKCENGNVYYSTATLTVAPVTVNVTAKIDGADVGDTYDCSSGDSFVLSFAANNGFAVTLGIDLVSSYLSASRAGSDVLFNAETVSSDTDVSVTIAYSVGTCSATKTIKFTIHANTGSAFTLTNTENVDIATGESVTVRSTANISTGYYYASSITISAPSGFLSGYFTSILYNDATPAGGSSLSGSSLTLYTNSGHKNNTKTFNLTLVINTANTIPATDITVTYVGYNTTSDYGWAKPQTYTAVYKIQVVGDVTVTLDANGGLIGGLTSKNVTEHYKSSYFKLTDAVNPTRMGYTFDGWYDSAVGGDKVVNGGTKTVGKETHTLYAHWNVNTYKVKYDANGGDAISDSKSDVTYGETYGALKTNPTRAGHTFDGWYDSPTGGNVITSDTIVNSSKASGSELTLYAHWTKNVYTVTLVYDNGTDSTYAVKAHYDDVFDLHLAITPTYAGHEFLGWYDSANVKQDGDITVKGDVTLTAHWKTVYTVTFNDGGAITIATYDVGTTYGSNATAFKSLDDTATHTFIGWAKSDTATTAAQCVKDTDTVTSSHTLYAIWNAVHTVTFNDGGTVVATAAYADGAKYNSDLTAFKTLADTETHTFVGWSTNPFATTEAQCVNGAAAVSSTHTLYAIWQEKPPVGGEDE